MQRGIAIDPGSKSSSLVQFTVGKTGFAPPWGILPYGAGDYQNEVVANALAREPRPADVLVIEAMPTVFGGAAARDQLKAERWGGRFVQAYLSAFRRVAGEGLVVECSSASAKSATVGKAKVKGADAKVRRALIDIYGGDDVAFGVRCKKCKCKGWTGRGRAPCAACGETGWSTLRGPLHGWTGSHVFRALACAHAAFRPGGLINQGKLEV